MLLYLARHAQTASSAVDSFNGQRELPLTEHGRELEPNETAVTYSAPLFDIREPYLWISVSFSAAPRANLPRRMHRPSCPSVRRVGWHPSRRRCS